MVTTGFRAHIGFVMFCVHEASNRKMQEAEQEQEQAVSSKRGNEDQSSYQ